MAHRLIFTPKRTWHHAPVFTIAHLLTAIILHISARRRHNRTYLAPIHTAQGGSSFIVGYANKETQSTGFKLLSAQFETVGVADGSATLADLKVSGYDAYDPIEDEGGTSGDFNIQFLSSSGTIEARYYWYDDDEKTGWFDRTGTSAADVEIPAGTGVWASGRGLTLRIPAPELN